MTQDTASEGMGFLASLALGFYALPLVMDLYRFLAGTNAANGDGVFVLYLVGYAAPAWIAFSLCDHPLHNDPIVKGLGMKKTARAMLTLRGAWGLLVDAVVWTAPLAIVLPAAMGSWETAILLSFVVFGWEIVDANGLGKSKRPILVIGAMVVCTGLVLGIASFAVNTSAISSANTPTTKVEAASLYVRESVFSTSWGRFGGDVMGFVFTGLGRCQENANIESWLLNQTGVVTRTVSLAGEDHAFVEVNIDGTWYSSDPGYNVTMATRWERGASRLAEMGGLSLAWVQSSSSPVFVTDQYVPTDTITIQVFKGGSPYANGTIELKHQFHGGQQGTVALRLDGNGTYSIKLGSMDYKPAQDTDHFYWIYVDEAKTSYKVTSHGNYSNDSVAVDVP